VSNHRLNILRALYQANDDGLTDHELATLLHVSKNQLPTRRRDLELVGLCRKTGKHRQTDGGVSAVVHVITPLGREYVDCGKSIPNRPQTDEVFEPLEEVLWLIEHGYDFQCSRVEGEDRYFALIARNLPACPQCQGPMFFSDQCSFGDTPNAAIEAALARIPGFGRKQQ
jgi:hypothetical protein